MALTKEKKDQVVVDIREKVSSQTVVYLVNYKGIKTRDIEALRADLKNHDANIVVIKKTLAKIAFQKEGINFNPEEIKGEMAFVFCFGDIVSPAKVITDFAKDFNIEISGAILESEILDSSKVDKLAKLPGKDQLRAQLLATMNAPLTGFVGVLEGNIKGLINVLKRVSEK